MAEVFGAATLKQVAPPVEAQQVASKEPEWKNGLKSLKSTARPADFDGSQPNLDPVAKNGGEASAYNVSLKKVGNPEASPAKAQEKEGTPYNISLKKVDTVERKEPEAAESTSPYAKVELKSVSSTGNKAEGPDAAAIYKEQQAKLKSVNK